LLLAGGIEAWGANERCLGFGCELDAGFGGCDFDTSDDVLHIVRRPSGQQRSSQRYSYLLLVEHQPQGKEQGT